MTAPPPWHSLLAALPADAGVRRRPVLGPEQLTKPESAAIAGWTQLTVELSAGAAGLRHVLVVLDEHHRLLSASDAVLHVVRDAERGTTTNVHESIGGRFEADGSFNGTRWHAVTAEPAEAAERPAGDTAEHEAATVERTKSAPTAEEVAALRALVVEVLARSDLDGVGGGVAGGVGPHL